MQLSAPRDGLLVDKLEGCGGDVGPASPPSPGSPGGTTSGGKVGKGGEGGKPVKVLPCPRCESMNTKFCYYNNYSVNQPRHFCRQCQRYWTAGGTLRNVPVGGGSRKKTRHQRGPGAGAGAGEPCMVRGGGGAGSSLAMARSGAGGNPQHHVLANGFQQLLTQDMVGMNFSQLPGYGGPPNNHFASFSLDPSQGVYPPLLGGGHKPEQEDLTPMHAMYGASVPLPGAFSYCTDMGGESLGGSKAEYSWAQGGQPQGGQMLGGYSQGQSVWEQSTRHTSASPRSAVEDESGGAARGSVPKNGYESSMLLHLGLNSWPGHHQQVQQVGKQQQQPTPAAWDGHQAHQRHQPVSTTTTTAAAAAAAAGTKPLQATNGSSPPHGSSTIEEEGSTPTNGYSTSGYEEGDAVSSMWHDMHDMQDIFQ